MQCLVLVAEKVQAAAQAGAEGRACGVAVCARVCVSRVWVRAVRHRARRHLWWWC